MQDNCPVPWYPARLAKRSRTENAGRGKDSHIRRYHRSKEFTVEYDGTTRTVTAVISNGKSIQD